MELLKKLINGRVKEPSRFTVTFRRSEGENTVKVYRSRNFEQAEIKVRISVPGKMGEQVLDAVRGYCRGQKKRCGNTFGYEIKIT